MIKHTLPALLFAVIALDLITPLWLATNYPNYSHIHDTISTLSTAKSPVQTTARLALAGVGILLTLIAMGHWLIFKPTNWAVNAYASGVLLFGISTIIAAIFPEDAAGLPETIRGKIHGIASGLGFIALILCPLWALWIEPIHQLSTINALLFAAAVCSFVLFLQSERYTSGWQSWTGLYQRLNLAILYGGLLLNYWYVITF